MISLGDGGAHCGYITDAGLPTFMLTHWTRDRTRGPRCRWRTSCGARRPHTASVYGLADRGAARARA